ncbi:MAG: hypothetical protein GY703_05285 [Gammaproteobacteria bacterium]|nr:hypothetical protein [Gammaproteobacteria bacterium]
MSNILIVLIFVLIVAGAIFYEKRRGDDMETVAGRLGFTFHGGQHRLPGELDEAGFDLFTQGPPNIKNRMVGRRGEREVTLFDFHYKALSSGEGQRGFQVADDHDSIERRSQGVVWFRSQSKLPDFDLSPKRIHMRNVGSRFGLGQVTFDGASGFNQEYNLLARDAQKMRTLFTDQVMTFLADHPGIVLESRGQDVLFYRFEKLPKPRDIPRFLEEGETLLDLLQQVFSGSGSSQQT